MRTITMEAELAHLYDAPVPTSILKEVDHITADYARLIAAFPLPSWQPTGPEGLDCSPRGDPRLCMGCQSEQPHEP